MKEKILRNNLYIGLLVLITSEILLIKNIPFMKTWFFCFAWWSFITIVDSLNFRKRGHSPLSDSPKGFLFTAFISVFVWLIFELFNLRLKNWTYHELPHSFWKRWLGFFISFASVIPAIQELALFFESFLKKVRKFIPFQVKVTNRLLSGFIVLGVFSILLPLSWPKIFFPLVWICFILVLEPINYWLENETFLRELEGKRWTKILSWLLAGCTAGIFWELWNFCAESHWQYSLPFLNFWKVFQMPVIGYTGFLPFALEIFALYQFIYWLNKKFKGKIVLKSLAFIFLLLFYATSFYLIDMFTLVR
ncbi:MAG: hypothetical protein ACETWK_06265 [Candidatus Aminicenantaceae bacterium]